MKCEAVRHSMCLLAPLNDNVRGLDGGGQRMNDRLVCVNPNVLAHCLTSLFLIVLVISDLMALVSLLI